MFKPTPPQIRTFLILIQYAAQMPESYKKKEDGLYKWLAQFSKSFGKERKLTLAQWKELSHMPVVDLVKMMNE